MFPFFAPRKVGLDDRPESTAKCDISNQMVSVTLLGPERRKTTGRIAHLTGKRLNLVLSQALPVGTLLAMQWKDALLLGEVCFCSPEADEFSAGVEVEHALWNLPALYPRPAKTRAAAV